MLAGIKCLTCIVDDLVDALEIIEVPEGKKIEILKKSMEHLSKNFSTDVVPSQFITDVHRIIKNKTGIQIPFEELRKNCNKMGLEIAKLLEKDVSGIEQDEKKFTQILKWCVAGNHLDFRTAGKGYWFNIKKAMPELKKIAGSKFSIDESKKVFNSIKTSRRILFVHDNVGEIAIDRVLIEFFKEKGKTVVSALRGGAITSDATISDGIAVGIDKIADRIIPAGPDTLGISWKEMSEELKKELKSGDLIISKGQANFYVLSEHLKELPPVVFLLTTKCDYVSNIFGFIGKGGVIKLYSK